MANKVVGIFQSASQAEEVAEFLDKKGLQRSEVRVSSEKEQVDANTEDTAKMNEFFENLIKADNPTADTKRGNSFLIIYGANETEASYAAEILYEYGAVEVHEENDEGGEVFKNFPI
jgi:thioredoxin-like negative regulator of GroEL